MRSELDQGIEHAKRIVKRLGYHPLAVTQAAAYIAKCKINFEAFLDHYNRRGNSS
jgi:hypothetical protein